MTDFYTPDDFDYPELRNRIKASEAANAKLSSQTVVYGKEHIWTTKNHLDVKKAYLVDVQEIKDCEHKRPMRDVHNKTEDVWTCGMCGYSIKPTGWEVV